MWERARNVLGERKDMRGGDVLKNRKGFGYGVRKSNARPSSTSIQELP